MIIYRPQDDISTLQRILDNLLPMGLIKRRNPLFDYQFKRLSWPPSGRTTRNFEPISQKTMLRRYTYIAWTAAAMAILPFAGTILDSYGSDYIQPVLLIIVGFSLLADIYYMMTSINTLVTQIKDTQWDLLRLTSLTEPDILLASYATIQVRVWRITVIETALRIFACLILVLNFSYGVLSHHIEPYYAGYILALLIVSIGYIVEPLWRMRAVTLLSMTVTARFSDFGMAVIIAFAGVVALLVSEVIIVVGLTVLSNAVSYSLINLNASTADVTLKYETITLITFTIMLVAVWRFFKAVTVLLFRRLKRVAFRG